VLQNPQTGENWALKAPSVDEKNQIQPSTFVVLPTRPKSESLTVLDNRTGKVFEFPVENNAIDASHFKDLVGPAENEPLRIYDPAFQNTAVAKSSICYIDGDNGILHYRGEKERVT